MLSVGAREHKWKEERERERCDEFGAKAIGFIWQVAGHGDAPWLDRVFLIFVHMVEFEPLVYASRLDLLLNIAWSTVEALHRKESSEQRWIQELSWRGRNVQ